jgi:hypothetical protein
MLETQEVQKVFTDQKEFIDVSEEVDQGSARGAWKALNQASEESLDESWFRIKSKQGRHECKKNPLPKEVIDQIRKLDTNHFEILVGCEDEGAFYLVRCDDGTLMLMQENNQVGTGTWGCRVRLPQQTANSILESIASTYVEEKNDKEENIAQSVRDEVRGELN